VAVDPLSTKPVEVELKGFEEPVRFCGVEWEK
jgi:hypothetical protein